MNPTSNKTKPLLLHITTIPQTLLAFFDGQIHYMKSKGFEVAALSSPGKHFDLVKKRDGIEIHEIAMQRNPSPFADLVSLFRTYRLLRKLRPAIIHTHTPKAGLIGIVAAWLARVPVRIHTLHGIRSIEVVGLREKIVDACEKITCKLSHKIFAVSKSVRNVALEQGFGDSNKIELIGEGTCNGIEARNRLNPDNYPVNTRSVIRSKYGIPKDAKVLCFVGRIVRDKGVVELVEAWQKLQKEFADIYLLIIGEHESDDAVGPEITAIIDEDERIIVTGFVHDMPEHYCAVDLVTLPTYREGFPYVPMESGAMELAVVGTEVRGCVDAIVDGLTGVLVPPRDSERLYEAIKELLLNEDLCKKMGQAARQRILSNFKPEMIWSELYCHYVSMMQKRNLNYDLKLQEKVENCD